MKKKEEPLLYRLMATTVTLSGLIELIRRTKIDNENKYEKV